MDFNDDDDGGDGDDENARGGVSGGGSSNVDDHRGSSSSSSSSPSSARRRRTHRDDDHAGGGGDDDEGEADAIADGDDAAQKMEITTRTTERPSSSSSSSAVTHLLDEETGKCMVDVLVSSMAFAMGEVNPDGPTLGNWSAEGIKALDVPGLQAINLVGTYDEWMKSRRGLNPLDTAMNVAIPEFDGRIITLPISFMAPVDETNSVQYYQPVADRVEQVAKQAARLAILHHKPNREKHKSYTHNNQLGYMGV